MANFSLKNFRTEVARRGLAKPNRFEVIIQLPVGLNSNNISSNDTRLLSLFCESAMLPTQTINVKQQRIYGPYYQRPISVEYGSEGIPMTFLIDQQMNIKALFDAWMTKIIDPMQYFVNYQNTYTSRITINQLDQKDKVTYSVVLEDAFPRSVALIELNNSTQNQVHKLNVTFTYRRWAPSHRITDGMIYPTVNANEYQKANDFRRASDIDDESTNYATVTKQPGDARSASEWATWQDIAKSGL
jgi:hypothetical protein